MDERCRRMVIGHNYGTRFQTQEVITKLKARDSYLCHECGELIHKGEEYYQDRLKGWARFSTVFGRVRRHTSSIYGRGWRRKLSYNLPPKMRFYNHLVCGRCWHGIRLCADGDLVKFVNRSKPEGSKVSYAFWEG